jgi:hypothetical protein
MNKFFSKCVSFVLSPLVSFLRKEIQIAVENYDAEKVVAEMWKDSFEAKVHEELAKLDLIQKVDEACDRYNFESRIEQEVDNFEIDYQVRKAFEDVDVQDIVSDAAGDYDFSDLVKDSVDDYVTDFEWQDLIVDKLAEFDFTDFFENDEKITNDVVAYFKQKLDDALEDRFGHINERLGTIEMQDQHYAVDIKNKLDSLEFKLEDCSNKLYQCQDNQKADMGEIESQLRKIRSEIEGVENQIPIKTTEQEKEEKIKLRNLILSVVCQETEDTFEEVKREIEECKEMSRDLLEEIKLYDKGFIATIGKILVEWTKANPK